MSVVGSALVMDRPKGTFELGKQTVRVPYRVIVDSVLDGPLTVAYATGLPALFTTYTHGSEYDTEMRLVRYESEPISSAPTMAWRVDCVYETPHQKESKGGDSSGRSSGGGTGRQTAGEFTNPLLEIPTVKWHSSGKEALLTRIYDTLTGTFKPCTASNGEVFDPPPKTLEAYATLEITRNEPLSTLQPATALTYANAVNSDTWWGMPAGYWRMKEIVPERQDRKIPNSPFTFGFLRVSYAAEFNPNGWDLQLLDYGSYYWARQANASLLNPGNMAAQRRDIMSSQGHKTSAPLNGNGQPLPDRMPYTPTAATPGVVSIAGVKEWMAFSNGDLAMFSGIAPVGGARPVAPAGLSYGTAYYVRNQALVAGTQTFNVSATAAGALIAFADIGTGWQYVYSPGVFFNIRPFARLPYANLLLPQSFLLVQ